MTVPAMQAVETSRKEPIQGTTTVRTTSAVRRIWCVHHAGGVVPETGAPSTAAHKKKARIHAAELGPLLVERGIAETAFAARLLDRHASLVLLD